MIIGSQKKVRYIFGGISIVASAIGLVLNIISHNPVIFSVFFAGYLLFGVFLLIGGMNKK
ncbi:MAG: hypothetical protein ACRCX8_03260 [Sarcina sp.]